MKITTEEFIQKCKQKFGNKYDYSNVEYIRNDVKIKIFCNQCKQFFEQSPKVFLRGYGCTHCNLRSNENLQKYRLTTIDRFKKLYGERYNYDRVVYKNYESKVEIFCNKCKRYFWQVPNTHLNGSGCPYYKQSKGEILIQDLLTRNHVNFIYQKRFKDCKDKQILPFDFYLTDSNTCIEFQGKQHFEPFYFISRLGLEKGILKFNNQQKHDLIKKEYCKSKNIKLIEIKYNENIKQKLFDASIIGND